MNDPAIHEPAKTEAEVNANALALSKVQLVTPIVALIDEICAPEVIVPPPCYFWNV